MLYSRLAALERRIGHLTPGKRVKVLLHSIVSQGDSVSAEINGEHISGTKKEVVKAIRKAHGIKKRAPYLILLFQTVKGLATIEGTKNETC